jgi:hypothetical protein
MALAVGSTAFILRWDGRRFEPFRSCTSASTAGGSSMTTSAGTQWTGDAVVTNHYFIGGKQAFDIERWNTRTGGFGRIQHGSPVSIPMTGLTAVQPSGVILSALAHGAAVRGVRAALGDGPDQTRTKQQFVVVAFFRGGQFNRRNAWVEKDAKPNSDGGCAACRRGP